MMILPTLIVRDARRGKWTVSVAGYGRDIPVCHQMFLTGDSYDQPCPGANWPKKEAQAEEIARRGVVCISTDYWSAPPGTPGPVERHRTRYVGLFRAFNARFEDRHLRFVLGERLCNLRR